MKQIFRKYCAVTRIGAVVACAIAAPVLQASDASEPPQAQSLVSLEDYLRQAQIANPQLKAFERRYEAAMQRIPQVSALPDPMFQITSFVESVQTRTGPQENVLMLSQRIPWFGKLSSREAAASADAEALWYAYQSQHLMLARTVSLGFYEYGYTEEAIRLTRENRDLLRELEPVVEEKVRAGGEINALLRLKVEIGKIDDRLQSLTQKRVAQSAQLSELLALPETSLLAWPEWEAPKPVSLNGPALVQAIRASNPELQMLKRKVASAEARREIARLESYPDITLGINYIQIGDPEVNPTTPDAGNDPWGVTVAVNIPIWFGKYDAAKEEALASKRSSEHEYENRYNALRGELSASLALLADANRRLTLYGEELLGLAEQAVENTRESYQNGRTGILELIDSERSLLDLQLLYWRAAADASQQRVVIQTLANQPILGTFYATDENE
ncbi:TolC family protein [Coraliomargarita sp. SDUM461003]|uniref:TolC family protein n=1 Tax=Thalassobacterium maritimum TaxID=3041265 RepID=A0ABU1AZ43_9BACT|nr:TolC family protein [Coraliomargarita sp. SDUM461003]MDQ8209434.1 TolC family protein [Coraliomargarita sp. SDUM461003]